MTFMNMNGDGLYFLRSPIWKKLLKASQRLPRAHSTMPNSELCVSDLDLSDWSEEATVKLKKKRPAVKTKTLRTVDSSIGWYLLGFSRPTTRVIPTIDRLFGDLIIVSNT